MHYHYSLHLLIIHFTVQSMLLPSIKADKTRRGDSKLPLQGTGKRLFVLCLLQVRLWNSLGSYPSNRLIILIIYRLNGKAGSKLVWYSAGFINTASFPVHVDATSDKKVPEHAEQCIKDYV